MSLFPHYKSVSWDADSPHKPKQALCPKGRLLWFILAQNFLCKILELSYPPNNKQFLCSSWSSPFRISLFLKCTSALSASVSSWYKESWQEGAIRVTGQSHSTGSSRIFPINRERCQWAPAAPGTVLITGFPPKEELVQWLCLRLSGTPVTSDTFLSLSLHSNCLEPEQRVERLPQPQRARRWQQPAGVAAAGGRGGHRAGAVPVVCHHRGGQPAQGQPAGPATAARGHRAR